MTCNEANSLLTDSLTPEQSHALEAHLAECENCRREQQSLEDVLQLISSAQAPEVEVDVQAIYQAEAERQKRQVRRWKRVAVMASLVAAASVLIVLWVNLEVTVEKHQLVIRWGQPPVQQESPPPVIDKKPMEDLARQQKVNEEQLRILSMLVDALADDARNRDAAQQKKLALLQARLEGLQQRVRQWQVVTERDLTAFYQELFTVKKGQRP